MHMLLRKLLPSLDTTNGPVKKTRTILPQPVLVVCTLEVRNQCFVDFYKDSYCDKIETVIQNRNKFEHFSKDVADFLEDIEQFGIPEDAWEVIAPETEKEQIEEHHEGPELEQSVFNAFDSAVHQRVATNDKRSTSFQYEVSTKTYLLLIGHSLSCH